MKLEVTHEYNCSSDEFYRLFTSKGFHKKKFAACGARKITVLEESRTKEGFSITVDREMPADVPGVLKSLVGEWNRVKQTENWEDLGDGEYVCELHFEPEGVPIEVSGTMNVMPDGDGCVNHVEMTFDCRIPLVGKKLAAFAAQDAENTLDAEFDYISAKLD